MPTFKRPEHKKDDGKAHIKFGEDPRPNLKQFGYCVVEDVFTKEECDSTINQMWKWLEGLGTGVKRESPGTWTNKHWPHVLRQGMFQHTLGQEEFMWTIREHENVVKIYETIFGTDKLLVSFDGANILRPIEAGATMSINSSWVHTDQDLIKYTPLEDVYTSNLYSVQGIANFEDALDMDGSLFLGESSHLVHSKLFEHNKREPHGNWYILTKPDLDYLEKDQKIEFVKVNAPKGSFILFDSRCFHSGYPHQHKRKTKNIWRYTIYVSMTPANRALQKDLDKKRKAVKEGKCTSHWSSNNIKVFPYPRTYGKACPYMFRDQNKPDYGSWSDKRKRLAGLETYPEVLETYPEVLET